MIRKADHGVTLLELLVSLAVLALIAVAMASTLNTGRQIWNRTENVGHKTEIAIARQTLRNFLEHVPLPKEAGRAQTYLSGQAGSVTFLSFPETSAFDLSEPVTVVTLADVVGFRVEGKLSLGAEAVVRQYLLAPPNSFWAFSYFGASSATGPRTWSDTWQSTFSLPDLIKIEITDAGGQVQPPLTVVPGRIWRQREMSLSSLLPPG